jgi:hypothetical protein
MRSSLKIIRLATPEYIQDLKATIRLLKEQNKNLKKRLERQKAHPVFKKIE